MKNRTARFLIISIICISILCVLDFSFMTFTMNQKGADVVGELGTIYLEGMSEQYATHFETTIELNMSKVGTLVDSVSPGSNRHFDQTITLLRANARKRGFNHLALYDANGNFEMLYGENIEVDDPESFLQSVIGQQETMSTGVNAKGEKLILMAVPAAYPMGDDKKSIALVATLPVSYISDTLKSNADAMDTYFFIIHSDGDFILSNNDIDEIDDDNYFDRVRNKYESIKGLTSEQFISAVKRSMSDETNISGEFVIDGNRRHLYGTNLSISDWYLLLFMPYGQIDETVTTLGNSWTAVAVVGSVTILAALVVVFAFYLNLTRKHMRELEAARSAAENANKAKSEFLSNMSHDIRTPMNGIVGMTAIANANINNPEQVKNCLNKIDLSSRHLLGLINDILDMSKIESGKLTLHSDRMSLRENIQSVAGIVQPQISAKKQSFNVYIYNIINEYIYCDGVRFNQVLLNLLGNAVKFTHENGNISIVCYEEPSQKGSGFVKVHLRVKDNGIGMTKEFIEKIYDAFSREDNGRVQKIEGSGLGMAITKYIVDAMNGTIDIKSEQGKGTEFHITIEFETAPVEAEEMTLPPIDVLVLDPDELTCESVVSALGAMGCRGQWVDCDTALELISRRHDDGNDFKAILIEEGQASKDGYAFVRKIRELCKSAICLLAPTDWCGEDKIRDVGIYRVIKKPIFRSDLYYGLKDLCDPNNNGQPEHEKEAMDFTGKRVLLAEDNELNSEIAQELLSELGFEVDHAEDGKICADKFAASRPNWYDVILMDIRMPVMNGYESTEAIRKMDRKDAKTIPIIAMSADAFSEDVKKCLNCGMNAHTAKPINIDAVAKLLMKYISERDKGE